MNSRVDSVINFLADRRARRSRTSDGYIHPFFFSSLDFPPTLRILSVVSKTRLTNSIIITRSGGARLLPAGVYQLPDEERHYRSHYRPRKLPPRYVGSFVNVDRKIARRPAEVIGPFPEGLAIPPAHIRTNKYV